MKPYRKTLKIERQVKANDYERRSPLLPVSKSESLTNTLAFQLNSKFNWNWNFEFSFSNFNCNHKKDSFRQRRLRKNAVLGLLIERAFDGGSQWYGWLSGSLAIHLDEWLLTIEHAIGREFRKRTLTHPVKRRLWQMFRSKKSLTDSI